jgi:hypothetical protein
LRPHQGVAQQSGDKDSASGSPLNLRHYCHRADTLAALVGAGLIAAHVLKRRIARIMINIHATVAVSDFVILAAYIFAG